LTNAFKSYLDDPHCCEKQRSEGYRANVVAEELTYSCGDSIGSLSRSLLEVPDTDCGTHDEVCGSKDEG